MKCEDCRHLRADFKMFGEEDNYALPAKYGDYTNPCNRYPQNIMRGPKEPACGEFKPAANISAPLESFEWSVRVRNTLRKLGVTSTEQLIQLTEVDLFSMKNFGPTSLQEVRKRLGTRGLRLKEESEETNED